MSPSPRPAARRPRPWAAGPPPIPSTRSGRPPSPARSPLPNPPGAVGPAVHPAERLAPRLPATAEHGGHGTPYEHRLGRADRAERPVRDGRGVGERNRKAPASHVLAGASVLPPARMNGEKTIT